MNLILVDADCETIMENETLETIFPNSRIKKMVISNDWFEKEYSLEEMEQERFEQCVLLTSFSGGIKKYHRELILRNQNCSRWIISILDVEHENYKQQFLNRLDQMLSESSVLYAVLFDSSKSLCDTSAECAISVGQNPTCVVVSHDETLLAQTKELIGKIFSGWNLTIMSELDEKHTRLAKCVLLTGKKPDDFSFAPLYIGLNRIYLWCLCDNYDLRNTGKSQLKDQICKRMFADGWNFSDLSTRIYLSNSMIETFWQGVQSEVYSPIALRNDETFVLWDRFGLPVGQDAYSEGEIESFLEEHSAFAGITKKIL